MIRRKGLACLWEELFLWGSGARDGTPAPEVRGILSAGVWCGCGRKGCLCRKEPAQLRALVAARPPLRLWECCQPGGCHFKVLGGVAWGLWSAAHAEGGYAGSKTKKSAEPTISKACGRRREEAEDGEHAG